MVVAVDLLSITCLFLYLIPPTLDFFLLLFEFPPLHAQILFLQKWYGKITQIPSSFFNSKQWLLMGRFNFDLNCMIMIKLKKFITNFQLLSTLYILAFGTTLWQWMGCTTSCNLILVGNHPSSTSIWLLGGFIPWLVGM